MHLASGTTGASTWSMAIAIHKNELPQMIATTTERSIRTGPKCSSCSLMLADDKATSVPARVAGRPPISDLPLLRSAR